MDKSVGELTRTCFFCPLCKSEYLNKSMAEACMGGHIEPEEIVNSYYRARDRYPNSIRIHFSDGSEVMYIHESEVEQP